MYGQEEADLLRKIDDLNRELVSAQQRADYAEQDVEQLKSALAREEVRTSEAQKEIGRLRAVVRNYNRIEEAIKAPNSEKLFELWEDHDDDDLPPGVLDKCEELPVFNEARFLGFCKGYMTAAKLFEEG